MDERQREFEKKCEEEGTVKHGKWVEESALEINQITVITAVQRWT